MNENPRPRRFRFSLRTLLIGVTLLSIPCAYLGRQYQIMRERNAALEKLIGDGGGYATTLPGNQEEWAPQVFGQFSQPALEFDRSYVVYVREPGVHQEPPLLRRLMGDPNVWEICIRRDRSSPEYWKPLADLFPEVGIYYFVPWE